MLMRTRAVFLFGLCALLMTAAGSLVWAEPDSLTNEEWSAMPQISKISYVEMVMLDLKDKKVPLSKSSKEYAREIDELFAKKPDRAARSVSSILPSLVYANEPKCKAIMDELVKKKKIDPIEPLGD